ncbi:MAG TPA: hypothetical protein VFE33_21305 [Thermoanaerobaculia bacterium]|nr:hypothetical protein [Thermoanaerobaculia bacterium]
MRPTTLIALGLLAATLAGPARAESAAESKPAPAPAAETQRKPPEPQVAATYTRFQIRFLDAHAAEVLAWQQCPPDAGEKCRIATASDDHSSYLDVVADAPTRRKIAEVLARADAAPHTQSFQLVLLVADQQPGDPSTLSKNAKKALDDLRDFLPYKGYHQLDTAWLRTTGVVQARLVGKDGISYSIRLNCRGLGAEDSKDLYVRSFEVYEELSAAIQKENRGPRSILSTSFGLKVGETLVVGTSKLDGGDALVFLLTALPPT